MAFFSPRRLVLSVHPRRTYAWQTLVGLPIRLRFKALRIYSKEFLDGLRTDFWENCKKAFDDGIRTRCGTGLPYYKLSGGDRELQPFNSSNLLIAQVEARSLNSQPLGPEGRSRASFYDLDGGRHVLCGWEDKVTGVPWGSVSNARQVR